jgi:internalin A
MPKGMITRFIVEMHRLIDRELVWKDGVILKSDDTHAEVIEARYRNEIRIRISGKIKKPLLEKIRGEFDKIHDSYGDRLRYQEYIPCNCATCKSAKHPFSYELQRLYKRLQKDQNTVQCDESYEDVSVCGLIDDTIGPDAHTRSPGKGDDRNIINNYYGDQVGGDKIGGDKVGGNKTTQ